MIKIGQDKSVCVCVYVCAFVCVIHQLHYSHLWDSNILTIIEAWLYYRHQNVHLFIQGGLTRVYICACVCALLCVTFIY